MTPSSSTTGGHIERLFEASRTPTCVIVGKVTVVDDLQTGDSLPPDDDYDDTSRATVKPPSNRLFGWYLLIFGAIAFVASFDLTLEKFRLTADPNYVPTCSLNPILSCGSVMLKAQAEAFGFPNSFLGIAGFAIVCTIGAGLLAGAVYRMWFWVCLLVASFGGLAFIHWLAWQSLYSIGALCPYCMVVWTVMIPTFVYVLFYLLRNLAPNSAGIERASKFGWALVIVWYAVFFALIILRFPNLFG